MEKQHFVIDDLKTSLKSIKTDFENKNIFTAMSSALELYGRATIVYADENISEKLFLDLEKLSDVLKHSYDYGNVNSKSIISQINRVIKSCTKTNITESAEQIAARKAEKELKKKGLT